MEQNNQLNKDFTKNVMAKIDNTPAKKIKPFGIKPKKVMLIYFGANLFAVCIAFFSGLEFNLLNYFSNLISLPEFNFEENIWVVYVIQSVLITFLGVKLFEHFYISKSAKA